MRNSPLRFDEGVHGGGAGPPDFTRAEADRAVQASDREWTILRPGGLTDDPGSGSVRLGEDPYRGRVTRDGQVVAERPIGSAEELGQLLDETFNVMPPAPVEEIFARIEQPAPDRSRGEGDIRR